MGAIETRACPTQVAGGHTPWPIPRSSSSPSSAATSGPYTGVLSPPGAAVVLATTVDFLDTYLKGRLDGLGRLRRDANEAGISKLESVP